MTFVTPTYRHKLVRSRCESNSFGNFLVMSCCFFDFAVGVGAFVIGLIQIFSLFSNCQLFHIFKFNIGLTYYGSLLL